MTIYGMLQTGFKARLPNIFLSSHLFYSLHAIKGGLKDLGGFFASSYAPYWLMLQDLFFLIFSPFGTSRFVSKLTTAAKTMSRTFIVKINSAPAAIVHSLIIEAAVMASHSNSLTQVSTNQSSSA